jgi:hypothetical protein
VRTINPQQQAVQAAAVARRGGRSRGWAPARFATMALAALVLLLPLAGPTAAAEGLVMDARAMLQGHARVAAWMGIEVRIRNDGPQVIGELRIAGGAQGRTRFSQPVDLPTGSDKTFRLYAQPPAFGGQIEVALVASSGTVAKKDVKFTIHDQSQLIVGVVAENARGIVRGMDLDAGMSKILPAVVNLTPEDLPERIEAWAPLDRLVWQDVDSARLSQKQLEALRTWVAGGGRLVIVGGTTGPAALSTFPDELLPYRPMTTIEAAPAAIRSLISGLPKGASDVPAMAGDLTRGRSLATSGDRTIAAETPYGGGSVTVIGFDPTVGWLAESGADEQLWRSLLPARTGSTLVISDDSQLVNAVSQLPALALPPIGGLLALLFGYIALIGPVNYLVLRKLDRREWAWITMPALIVVFAAGAYGFGTALRGLDVIVHEVAIVRGAPDATEGTAQVYVGIFSPGRGTYQVEVPGGALLSSTWAGDWMGGADTGLDIVQDEPARLRDLVIGFSSLRAVRAETAAIVPRIQAELRLRDGVLVGFIRNLSDQRLESPAVVLGSSVAVFPDLEPGAEQEISVTIDPGMFGQSLSDRIIGQAYYGDPRRVDPRAQRNLVRRSVIDQLTWDANWGFTGQLPAETPVLLAWGTRDVLDIRVEGQIPRRTGNVLFHIPLRMQVSGQTVFDSDLIRSSVVDVDAESFSRDPYSISLGRGTATLAYRPIQFDGTLRATRLAIGVNFGNGPLPGGPGKPIEPVPMPGEPDPGESEPEESEPEPPCDPNVAGCDPKVFFDGIPEIEIFDRTGDGAWVRLPHLAAGGVYDVASPAKYVDPMTGTVLVRLVNEVQDWTGFMLQVRIEGEVR